MRGEHDEFLDARFTFQRRSTPLPCDLRPVWRTAVLILILERCRGSRATLEQLHVMNWAIRNKRSQDDFLAFLDGSKSPEQVIVRYDPSLTRAVEFAMAEGVVARTDSEGDDSAERGSSYRLFLTPKGAAIAAELASTDECLVGEKQFLAAIGGKITQARVAQLFKWSHSKWG